MGWHALSLRRAWLRSDVAAAATLFEDSEFVNQSTFMHQSGGCSKNDRLGSRRSHDLALRRQIWPPEQNATSFFSQTLRACHPDFAAVDPNPTCQRGTPSLI